MRIGGGNANRRPLHTVAGRTVRPTSELVRQALFNMLHGLVHNVIFVDLFAGTGSVGLRLSVGASQVYFVEHDRRALRTLQANIIVRCDMVDGQRSYLLLTRKRCNNCQRFCKTQICFFLIPPTLPTGRGYPGGPG
jgi:16S rRNA (guanine(966)-N(2))-methyltransferase RsmD